MLSMVDWGGEERARVVVRASEFVLRIQKQIWEQTGVRVSDQRLVFGEVEMEGAMSLTNSPGLREGTIIQLTVIANKV